MKIKVTIDKRDVLAAIGEYLLGKGVPLVAGTFSVRCRVPNVTAWTEWSTETQVEAIVEFEADAYSSERGALTTGKDRDLQEGGGSPDHG